jgi:sarcosine oxidase subunit gamma
MSESLIRTEPVPALPVTGDGICISLAPPMSRFSLRARQPQALETLLGVPVPGKIGTTRNGIACLGPDEWLLRAAAGTQLPMGHGLPVSVVDVSERAIGIVVEGPSAAALLMTGCPLDLNAFAVGRAARTIFETVEIILIRVNEDRFEVEVWRSFAPWLWTALSAAAAH